MCKFAQQPNTGLHIYSCCLKNGIVLRTQAQVWLTYYLDCSIQAQALSPQYNNLAQTCETTQWGTGRRDRCPDEFVTYQLDQIHASCCGGAPTCTDQNFNAGSLECKCAVEIFHSRCISHVSDSYSRYLTDRLERIGLQLSQFIADPTVVGSGGILHKVQSDDHDQLVAINGAKCDLSPPTDPMNGH